MTVTICLLRGVNVVGNNQISMQALREICLSQKLRNPQTYIQSGNVVFGTAERDLAKLATRMEDCIEKGHGFRPRVMLRTVADMRDVVARNPFAARSGLDPGKLVVSFPGGSPQRGDSHYVYWRSMSGRKSCVSAAANSTSTSQMAKAARNYPRSSSVH